MNEFNPPPPALPGYSTPPPPVVPPAPPAGEPEDLSPIRGVIAAAESVLRQPNRLRHHLQQAGNGPLIGALVIIAVVSGLVYGFVVGTFSGGAQLWAAPLKVAGGLLVSALICLPSLYIFCCLSGAQARFADIAGLVAGLLALLTILLIGFAPVAWVFSQSTGSVAAMGGLHLVFWAIATGFGLRFLHAGFKRLRARTSGGLTLWFAIFVLVMLQMTTALRPLVGSSPDLLPKNKVFFVAHWWDCLASETLPSKPAE
jgi:hypothetical protein